MLKKESNKQANKLGTQPKVLCQANKQGTQPKVLCQANKQGTQPKVLCQANKQGTQPKVLCLWLVTTLAQIQARRTLSAQITQQSDGLTWKKGSLTDDFFKCNFIEKMLDLQTVSQRKKQTEMVCRRTPLCVSQAQSLQSCHCHAVAGNKFKERVMAARRGRRH